MKEKGKDRGVSICRKLLSIIAKWYEYKGREIAIYLHKDPSIITRYLKEEGKLRKETERVLKELKT